jgi:hypothetical protein
MAVVFKRLDIVYFTSAVAGVHEFLLAQTYSKTMNLSAKPFCEHPNVVA